MAVGPVTQIHLSVRDVDRSVAFYREVLGVPFLFQVPGMPMAFFQSGQVRLYLGVPTSTEYTSRSVVYFDVPDVDAEMARLAAAGVSFTDRPHVAHRDMDHELWMVALTDPDGHQLVLTERRPTGPTADRVIGVVEPG